MYSVHKDAAASNQQVITILINICGAFIKAAASACIVTQTINSFHISFKKIFHRYKRVLKSCILHHFAND